MAARAVYDRKELERMTIKELSTLLKNVKNRSKAKRKADMINMILADDEAKVAQRDLDLMTKSRWWYQDNLFDRRNDYYRPYVHSSSSEEEDEREIASGRGVPIDEYDNEKNMSAIIEDFEYDDYVMVVGVDLAGMFESTYDPNYTTTLESVYGYDETDRVKGGWKVSRKHLKDVERMLNRLKNGVSPFKTPPSLARQAAKRVSEVVKPSDAAKFLPSRIVSEVYRD